MVGNPHTETIDERIIKALNLDSEFEISYEEYIRHLKEAMIASRMTKSRYSSEETILFVAEFRRVRSKKGRFRIKVKKVKITASGLGLGGFTKPLQMTQKRLLLAPSSSAASGVGGEKDIFSKIDDLLASILSNVAEQTKETKKKSELERKDRENKKRKQKELGLEKGKQALKNIVSTITKPFQSLLDKIINFFVITFLGRAVFKLLEWFGDPKNKEKIDTIAKFLKDWWPALIGGYVLFGTKFGKGIRVLTKIAISAIGKLGKASFSLLRFAKRNPGSAGLIAAGGWAATQLTQRAFSGGGDQGFWGGGIARKPFASGGRVRGPGGIDRVPAWLTNGEFVMSKGAVDKYGVSTLEAMNSAGGGTNVPTIGHGGVYAAGGGAIGKATDLITSEEALSSLSPGSNDFIVPNGKSVVSNLGWNKIKPDTLLHAYPDTRNVPTIGWGSTFYDKLTEGIKPVKIGDTITKRKADEILRSHVQQLSSLYSTKMPTWKNMSQDQKAAVLSIGYNAGPNAPIGSYPKLSMALKVGDMPAAARNVVRSGPSAARIKLEQSLLLSGPKNTSKPAPAKTSNPSLNSPQKVTDTTKPTPLNFFQRATSAIGSLIRPRSKPQPSVVNMSSRKNGSSTSNTTTAQEPPMSFNAVHPKGTRIAEAVYGVRK